MPKKNTENTQRKYLFVLKRINTEKVDQRFGISIVSNITVDKIPENTTKISELAVNSGVPEMISFLDEAKKNHRCSVSMVDFYTEKEIERSSEYCCFWDRHPIPSNVIPIGCPIKYVYNQAVKSYYSEISKDNYSIKENITANKYSTISESKDKRLTLKPHNYYITDGLFCSFNCCMSYIMDNKHNSLYNISEMLLLKMYDDIHKSSSGLRTIEVAPHWRKLREYGGNLTIEVFRDSFNKLEFQNHGMVIIPVSSVHDNPLPKCKSVGFLFEEKLKFL